MRISKIAMKQHSSAMFVLSAIVLIDLISVLVAGEYTAVVRTTSGPVQGEILKTAQKSVTYSAFKGIRYGKAPIGPLRYKPPVEVDPWIETLNATTEGSACPQLKYLTNEPIGFEDCLFLNVYTPVANLSVAPNKLKSVMVWIHGGGYIFGSGSTEIQKPDYLLEKDVVFVSMNYRLGALGFLNFNHPNATGNAGLKDQALALRWIRSNIEKFGGNPNNVTIFGFSAGSVSVGFHIISEVSRELFHGAILQSGVPLTPWAYQTPSTALEQSKKLAIHLGCNSTDHDILLNALHDATPAELVKASFPMNPLIVFLPSAENTEITDNPFLTESPYKTYSEGNYNKVPVMLGFMEQEIIGFPPDSIWFFALIATGLQQATDIGIEQPASLLAVLGHLYQGKNLTTLDENTVQTAIDITSALTFSVPIDRTQRLLAANNDGKPVYYYHIPFHTARSYHRLAWPNSIPGAGHWDDTGYIFYVPFAEYSTDPNDRVARTIIRITTMWTNFAKYGNPTPNWKDNSLVGIYWPESGSCGRALSIDDELKVESRPINEEFDLIGSLIVHREKKVLGIPTLIRPIGKVST